MRPPASSSGSWRVHGSIGGGVAGWRDLLLGGRSWDSHPRARPGIDLDVLFAFLTLFFLQFPRFFFYFYFFPLLSPLLLYSILHAFSLFLSSFFFIYRHA